MTILEQIAELEKVIRAGEYFKRACIPQDQFEIAKMLKFKRYELAELQKSRRKEQS